MRYGEESIALWRKVIAAIYIDHGRGWNTSKLVGPHGSGLWKDIFKEQDNFQQCCTYQIGKGDRVLF